ncbi:SPOR domain-containing protein [Legionella sp.]|uniref:SPOR domain-containing protein n=1 Tax=Legionella sp. TaxID=459 RepID=UPI003CB47FB3
MNNNIKFAVVGFCALGISSCAMMDNSTGTSLNYPAYAPAYASYEDNKAYVRNNYKLPNNYDYSYYENTSSKQEIVVPDTYHVGEMRSPVSFQDQDQTWVSSQNPQTYTIELAAGDKPAKVAQTLYKAPKNDRMAQVKYQQGGKNYYRGVYGSYSNAAEAQKALEALPPEIKRGASVKKWGSIQP